MYFCYFVIISPWKRNESRSPRDTLCKFWLKLTQWFWRSRFLNFVNVFLLFHNYLPLDKGVAILLYKLNPLHPRMVCAKFGWNWPNGFREKKFGFRQCIFAISWLSGLRKEGGFIWTNLNPLHLRMLSAKFGSNWPSCSGEEDFFKISLMYFCLFVNISPWNRTGPFIWINLNLIHPMMLVTIWV